MTGNTKH